VRAVAKRAQAHRRAHRAASVAAVAYVAAGMRCAEMDAAMGAHAAAVAAQSRRLAAIRAQRMLVGGLVSASGPLGVASQYLRASLGVSAAPRLRILDLDARVALVEEQINADYARRQLRLAERRRAAALRCMHRSIEKLRRLRPPHEVRPLAQPVDLAAVMVATEQPQRRFALLFRTLPPG